MSQNTLEKFRQRNWAAPPLVQTLPSAPESREQILIDFGIAGLIAGVPLGAFVLLLLI